MEGFNMKRKLSAVLVLGAITVGSLVGCGSVSPSGNSPATGEEQNVGTTGGAEETKAGDEKQYKVAMIADASISDGGWTTSCYNAMIDAAKECGFEAQYSENVAQTDFTAVLRDYASMDFDLIFAPGNQYTDAVKEVAADFPDVSFALLNGTVETENITSMMPDAEQIGYMAGALAGLTTETDNIGFIGGVELDTTMTKLACYEKAAQKINPDIKVSSAMAGSFSDTAKGKEIAMSMVTTNDVDVMFGDASAVDTGARDALASQEKRYDIGQPGDLVEQNPDIILCSVVTDNAALVKSCMEDVKNGSFGNKTILGNLSNGCLSVGTFGNAVPDDIQKQYLDIIEQIKAGTFIE